MVAGLGAIVIGIALIAGSRWIAYEGDRSKLWDAFFLRIVWNASTNVWVVRSLGGCFIAFGVWGVATS